MSKLFNVLKSGIVWSFEFIGGWLQILFGMRWELPGWLQWLGRKTQEIARWSNSHRRQAALRGVVLVFVGASLVAGAQWYKYRPKPVETAVNAISPELTKLVEGKWETAPLVLNFKGSAAPLDKVGKVITPKINMSPNAQGTWVWQDDKTLVFTPLADWPVGMDYKLSLPKKGLVAAMSR